MDVRQRTRDYLGIGRVEPEVWDTYPRWMRFAHPQMTGSTFHYAAIIAMWTLWIVGAVRMLLTDGSTLVYLCYPPVIVVATFSLTRLVRDFVAHLRTPLDQRRPSGAEER